MAARTDTGWVVLIRAELSYPRAKLGSLRALSTTDNSMSTDIKFYKARHTAAACYY